jgi:hypothetical protein
VHAIFFAKLFCYLFSIKIFLDLNQVSFVVWQCDTEDKKILTFLLFLIDGTNISSFIWRFSFQAEDRAKHVNPFINTRWILIVWRRFLSRRLIKWIKIAIFQKLTLHTHMSLQTFFAHISCWCKCAFIISSHIISFIWRLLSSLSLLFKDISQSVADNPSNFILIQVHKLCNKV